MAILNTTFNLHVFSVEGWLPLLPRILDILILQDKTLFCAFEANDIVCWLVNQPIAKLDLFKSPDCCWICKTYAEYCCRSSAIVCRLVQSPTLQSTIFCGVHSDLRGKGIRVSPACFYPTQWLWWFTLPLGKGYDHTFYFCKMTTVDGVRIT